VPGHAASGFKTWTGQQSGRVRSIKPCFVHPQQNVRVICPAFLAIVACCHALYPNAVAQANLFATPPPKMLVGITQFQTHLLYDTLYIKFLFL